MSFYDANRNKFFKINKYYIKKPNLKKKFNKNQKPIKDELNKTASNKKLNYKLVNIRLLI